jgi:hypothetical protein
MSLPFHTVTLQVPEPQLPVFSTRLTTYLLHHHYTFLQTYHDATQSDFDIVHQQHPLFRLTLRSAARSASSPGVSRPALPPTLAAEAVAILHHLLQAGASLEEPVV